MKKFKETFWLGFGSVVLFSSLIAGAWWHLFTAGICFAMWYISRVERKAEEK